MSFSVWLLSESTSAFVSVTLPSDSAINNCVLGFSPIGLLSFSLPFPRPVAPLLARSPLLPPPSPPALLCTLPLLPLLGGLAPPQGLGCGPSSASLGLPSILLGAVVGACGRPSRFRRPGKRLFPRRASLLYCCLSSVLSTLLRYMRSGSLFGVPMSDLVASLPL